MRRRTHTLLLMSIALASPSRLLLAGEDPLGKDLTATIVLHGMTCDKVVDARRNGDSDYTATCRDGHRYHVYVDPTGRVIVKPL